MYSRVCIEIAKNPSMKIIPTKPTHSKWKYAAFLSEGFIQNSETLWKQCSGENKPAGWPQLRMTVYPEGLPFLICFSVFFTVWKAFYAPPTVPYHRTLSSAFLIPYACDCFFTLFFQLDNPKGKCLPSYDKKNELYKWIFASNYKQHTFCLTLVSHIQNIYFYLPVMSFSYCFDFFNCRLSWICVSAYFIWIFRINCNVMCFVFQFI